MSNRFEIVKDDCRKHEYVRFPRRADDLSAGFDFHSLEDTIIKPGEVHKFWTDLKVRLSYDEHMEIFPRSSYGVKKGLVLANSVGIIDAGYYGNIQNDGNICICLRNVSNQPASVKKGNRIAQGIIKKHITMNIPYENKRVGGLGSSGE